MENKKTIGIILSAGKQTRFDSQLPKALMKYNTGDTVLDINIKTMSKFCDVIYIIINKENDNSLYTLIKEKYDNVNLLSITSGLGDGHAVLKSLESIKYKIGDKVYLIWGDSIQDDERLFVATENAYNNMFTLPLRYEKEPYVQFIVEYGLVRKVKFKKYEETVGEGYHDYSLFLFNPSIMRDVLERHHNNYWKEEEQTYISRNNELVFLDIINEHQDKLFPHAVIIDTVGSTSNNAYNTIEEYKKIIKRGIEDDNNVK